MPWFPPLGLVVAWLCTRAGLQRRSRAEPRHRDWWLFFVIGWIPLLAWILSQWLEQY